MALISGTVLALKMAAKAILKKMTTQAIKKAVVKGVKRKIKKKVRSKIKDKLLGKKKDKRQLAKNIMQEHGEWEGGGAIVATPTTALIPKTSDKGGALAVIDKDGEGGGGSLDFNKMGEKIDNIVGMTDAIAMLTGAEKKQAKDQAKARQIAKAKADKKAREAKLEAKKGGGPQVPAAIKKPAQSLLDMMIKFLVNVALGAIVLSIIKLIANAKKIWEGIKEGFLKFFWIIRALLIKGFLPKLLLQGVTKSIRLLGGLIKGFVSKTLAPFKKVGSVIFNAFKGATQGIARFIGGIATKIGDVVTAVKNGAVNLIKKAFPELVKWADDVVQTGTKGVRGVRSSLQATRAFMQTTAQTARTGATGLFNRATGNVLRRGIGRGAQRIGLKVFGKGGVRAIGGIVSKAKGIFGRIPLIGPLMVAISGLLEDPPQPVSQILYRSFGAALGGFLGGLIGMAGGPLSIVGMMLGEMLGEFVGDLLYSLFHDGGISAVKEKFVAKMKQIWEMATGVGKWLGKGFINFTEGLLKKHPIDIKKGWGVRKGLTAAAKKLGLFNWLKKLGYVNSKPQVDKFPNILQVFNPMSFIPLLKDSFFKGDAEGTSTPAVTGASDASEVTDLEGEASTGSEIDDTKKSTSANLGKTDSGAGEDAAAVSSSASYEGQEGGNTIMAGGGGQSGGGFGGGGAGKVIIYGSKDALNSYIKAMNSKSLSSV